VGKPPTVGRRQGSWKRLYLWRGQHHLVQGTPEHSKEFLECLADPVASLGSVEPSQRAERGGSLFGNGGLRYVLIPWENQASVWRPDRSKCRGVSCLLVVDWQGGGLLYYLYIYIYIHTPTIKCCDALRCSGPHARYTDRASEYITLAERSG
jgi:hypothetical protein